MHCKAGEPPGAGSAPLGMRRPHAWTLPSVADVHWTLISCELAESGEDAVLFASVALLAACVLSGRLSALWVFIAGESLWSMIMNVGGNSP